MENRLHPIFESNHSSDFTQLSKILSTTPGYNLNDGPHMIKAHNDAQAIQSFLSNYQQVSLTYQTYLKELERLVLWCTHVQKVTISQLNHDDLVAYQQFLADPQPRAKWAGNKRAKRLKTGMFNPEWRPFAGPLSPSSIKKVMSILDSFLNYLVHTHYLKGNPLSASKRRGQKTNMPVLERWLEKTEINTVLAALTQIADSATEPFLAIRAKYIIHTLFYTGLRLGEITQHTMGHFMLIDEVWYLKVTGKGGKPRHIVVVDEYLDTLVRFRKALNCPSDLPAFRETTPLIPARDKISPIQRRRVDQILKWAFELGAKAYENQAHLNQDNAYQYLRYASKLRAASAHWLRHSYGTYLVKSGCPIEKVKALMGHADISTTMIYVHLARLDLHNAAQGLSLRGE